MMVEVEFSSLDHMAEWLTLNGLDVNSDGLPTMVPIEPPKLTLENTNSLLPELVKQIVKEKNDSHSLNPKCHLPSGNAGFSSDIDSNIYKNTSQEDILTKKNDIVAGDMSSSTESRLLLRTGEISKASSSSSHNRKIYDEKMDRRNRSYLEKSDKLPNDRSKYESSMKNVRKDKDGRFRRSDDRKLVGEKTYHGENPDIRSDRTLRRTQDHGRKREIVKSYTSRRYERSKGRDHEPQDSLQKKRRVEGDRKRKRSPIYDENKRKLLQPANKDEIKPRRSEDEYTENGRCTRNNELNFDNEEYEYNDGLSDPELVVVDDTELEDGEIE